MYHQGHYRLVVNKFLCSGRLAPAFILIQKAYYDTLIEFRGLSGTNSFAGTEDLSSQQD